MILIDDDQTTIHMNRGDATTSKYNRLALKCTYYDLSTEEEVEYEFKLEDKLSFVVYPKKGYTKEEILRKEFTIKDLGYIKPAKYPEIPLEEIDTKLFPLLNKKAVYWYSITLNNTATVIGHDADGAKKIIVYPEADEQEEN